MLNALTKQPFPIDFGHFNEGLAMISTVCIVSAIFSLIDEVTNVRRVQKHLRQFISCGLDDHSFSLRGIGSAIQLGGQVHQKLLGVLVSV